MFIMRPCSNSRAAFVSLHGSAPPFSGHVSRKTPIFLHCRLWVSSFFPHELYPQLLTLPTNSLTKLSHKFFESMCVWSGVLVMLAMTSIHEHNGITYRASLQEYIAPSAIRTPASNTEVERFCGPTRAPSWLSDSARL